MTDPLETLLGPRPVPAPPLAVFAATLRGLRARRRRQRLAQTACLLASCAAGLLLGVALAPDEPAGRPSRPAPAQAVVLAPPRGVDLEWQALEASAPAESAPLYRGAADRYLEEGDPENAVRTYGHALSQGGPADLELSPEDSFLLMAIKHARKKESNEWSR